MTSVNLLHAHGSPTNYLYHTAQCRCTSCKAACAEETKRYNSKPEVKARLREYRKTDQVRDWQSEYRRRPEVAERERDRQRRLRSDAAYNTPDALKVRRDRNREWGRRPEVVEHRKRLQQSLEFREHKRAWAKSRPRVLFCAAIKDAWVEASGGCLVCGYKLSTGIHPHHVDPATKAGNTGHMRWRGFPVRLAAELAKCACLCATHHTVFHAATPKWRNVSGDEIRAIVLAVEAAA